MTIFFVVISSKNILYYLMTLILDVPYLNQIKLITCVPMQITNINNSFAIVI